jgi:two-component system, chemotaxis family, response regulator WspF
VAGGVAVADRIRVLEMLIVEPRHATLPPAEEAPPIEVPVSPAFLVAIGAASGGPRALQVLLGGLTRALPAALWIVQDIEPAYAAGLASWLQEQTRFPVRLATPGASLIAGAALLAPLCHRIVLAPDHTLQHGAEPAEPAQPPPMRAEPSLDEFFGDLARHSPPGIAVLLSSLGRDGTEGLRRLHRAGWQTIRQSTPNHVRSDEPGTWHEGATLILPAEAIAPTIVASIARTRTGRPR